MADGKDSNGMRSQSWKDAPALKAGRVQSKADNRELFEQVRLLVQEAVGVVRGKADDDRYRYITDLIMLRVRGILSEKIDELDEDSETWREELLEKIEDGIAEASSDELVNRACGVSDTGFKEFTDNLIQCISSSTDKILSTYTASAGREVSNNAETVCEVDRTDGIEHIPTGFSPLPSTASADFITVAKHVGAGIARCTDIVISGIMPCSGTLQKAIEKCSSFDNIICKSNQTAMSVKTAGAEDQLSKLDDKQKPAVISQPEQHDNKAQAQTERSVEKTAVSGKRDVVVQAQQVQRVSGGKGIIQAVCTFRNFSVGFDSAAKAVAVGRKAAKKVFGKTVATLEKLAKAVRPKTLFETIVDWIFNKAMESARKKLLREVAGKLGLQDKLKFLIDGLDFKDILKKIFSKLHLKLSISEYLNGIVERMQTIAKGAMAIFKAVRKTVKFTFGKLWKGFKATISKIFRTIKSGLKMFWNIAKNALRFIGRILSSVVRFFGNLCRGVLKGITKLIPSPVKNFFTKAFGKIKSIGSKIGKFFGKIGQAFSKASNAVKGVFSKIGNAFKAVKNKIVGAVKSVAGKVKSFAKNVVKSVVKAVKKVVSKVVSKVVGFVRKMAMKVINRIVKALGINIAKKSGKKLGMKILIKFVKKFGEKLIKKVAGKLLAMAGINCIPGIGQIISIIMMIYTIVDTICMCWDVYKLFKENPGLFDILKEMVADWAKTTFGPMLKQLLEFGKKIFKWIFIDGPRALGHAIGDALFASNKECAAQKSREDQEIFNLNTRWNVWDTLSPAVQRACIKDNLEKSITMVKNERLPLQNANDEIARLEDEWCRDMNRIMSWMHTRQQIVKKIFESANNVGIFMVPMDRSVYYTEFGRQSVLTQLLDRKKLVQAWIAQEKEAKLRQKFKGCSVNMVKLAEYMRDWHDIAVHRKDAILEITDTVNTEYNDKLKWFTNSGNDNADDDDSDIDEDETDVICA